MNYNNSFHLYIAIIVEMNKVFYNRLLLDYNINSH